MANEEFKQESIFLICGKVKRRWVADSQKYGTIDIEVPGRGQYDDIVNARVFKDGPIAEIGRLIPGTVIKIRGGISTEAVKDKAGNFVMIDGYKKYVDVLTIKAIKVDESSIASARAAAAAAENADGEPPPPSEDDKVPAGW